jgi:hypothetical protein
MSMFRELRDARVHGDVSLFAFVGCACDPGIPLFGASGPYMKRIRLMTRAQTN